MCDRWEQGTARHVPEVSEGVTQSWKVQQTEIEEHKLCWFLSDDGGGSSGETLYGSEGDRWQGYGNGKAHAATVTQMN